MYMYAEKKIMMNHHSLGLFRIEIVLWQWVEVDGDLKWAWERSYVSGYSLKMHYISLKSILDLWQVAIVK